MFNLIRKAISLALILAVLPVYIPCSPQQPGKCCDMDGSDCCCDNPGNSIACYDHTDNSAPENNTATTQSHSISELQRMLVSMAVATVKPLANGQQDAVGSYQRTDTASKNFHYSNEIFLHTSSFLI
ncbi:MAG: hypothetical protein DWQ10_02945 [Calditrichaeota bacterium]|nr:MAG: hypothetical protein DWQ10_02945 [Calditrichota bacterium]